MHIAQRPCAHSVCRVLECACRKGGRKTNHNTQACKLYFFHFSLFVQLWPPGIIWEPVLMCEFTYFMFCCLFFLFFIYFIKRMSLSQKQIIQTNETFSLWHHKERKNRWHDRFLLRSSCKTWAYVSLGSARSCLFGHDVRASEHPSHVSQTAAHTDFSDEVINQLEKPGLIYLMLYITSII